MKTRGFVLHPPIAGLAVSVLGRRFTDCRPRVALVARALLAGACPTCRLSLGFCNYACGKQTTADVAPTAITATGYDAWNFRIWVLLFESSSGEKVFCALVLIDARPKCAGHCLSACRVVAAGKAWRCGCDRDCECCYCYYTYHFDLPFNCRSRFLGDYGNRTLSMTWMTPFDPTMSVAITLDLLT